MFTEKRKAEAERIRQKYPDRIPVRIQISILATHRTWSGLWNSKGYSRRGPKILILCVSPQVICEKADKTDIPTIDKKKYLVPSVSFPS